MVRIVIPAPVVIDPLGVNGSRCVAARWREQPGCSLSPMRQGPHGWTCGRHDQAAQPVLPPSTYAAPEYHPIDQIPAKRQTRTGSVHRRRNFDQAFSFLRVEK